MAGSPLHYCYTPLQQNIVCADTAIAALPATVDALGARRAMIICGPTILRACNVVPRVQEALGSRSVGVYAGVAPHAPVETVEEGVAMAKEVQPDVFISVGGGSTHDTTKAIATLLAEGGDLHDYAIRFEPPDRVIVPRRLHPNCRSSVCPPPWGAPSAVAAAVGSPTTTWGASSAWPVRA